MQAYLTFVKNFKAKNTQWPPKNQYFCGELQRTNSDNMEGVQNSIIYSMFAFLMIARSAPKKCRICCILKKNPQYTALKALLQTIQMKVFGKNSGKK